MQTTFYCLLLAGLLCLARGYVCVSPPSPNFPSPAEYSTPQYHENQPNPEFGQELERILSGLSAIAFHKDDSNDDDTVEMATDGYRSRDDKDHVSFMHVIEKKHLPRRATVSGTEDYHGSDEENKMPSFVQQVRRKSISTTPLRQHHATEPPKRIPKRRWNEREEGEETQHMSFLKSTLATAQGRGRKSHRTPPALRHRWNFAAKRRPESQMMLDEAENEGLRKKRRF